MVKFLLVLLCLIFPFIAVALRGAPLRKVLLALVLQLLGHIPGVIYGIVVVLESDPRA